MLGTMALSGQCRVARLPLLGAPRLDQTSKTYRARRPLCRAEAGGMGEASGRRAGQRAQDAISSLERLGIREEAPQPVQPQAPPAPVQAAPAVQKRKEKRPSAEGAAEEDPNDERTWNWDRFFAGVLFGAGLQGTILCIWVLKHTQLVSDWIELHGFW